MSGYSEGVEVNLAGWDGTLRRGKRKERSENPIIKERKKEENTERKKWKNQTGEVKRDWKTVRRREIIQVNDEGRNKDKIKRARNKKNSKEVQRRADKLICKEGE